MGGLGAAVDAVLDGVVSGTPRVPGVAAVATDRSENIYEGARRERVVDGGVGFTTDTVCAIFSTTKAIGGTACLQLVEEGKLDLDAPAKRYVPRLGEIQVLDGFDGDGQPILRPPVRDITTRHLLTHTAGFAYDFFNETYSRLADRHGQPWVVDASYACMETPLLFDPGEHWEYGSGTDWAGQVVEGMRYRQMLWIGCRGQAASLVVSVLRSVWLPSLNWMPAATRATSSGLLTLRQRAWAASRSL